MLILVIALMLLDQARTNPVFPLAIMKVGKPSYRPAEISAGITPGNLDRLRVLDIQGLPQEDTIRPRNVPVMVRSVSDGEIIRLPWWMAR